MTFSDDELTTVMAILCDADAEGEDLESAFAEAWDAVRGTADAVPTADGLLRHLEALGLVVVEIEQVSEMGNEQALDGPLVLVELTEAGRARCG